MSEENQEQKEPALTIEHGRITKITVSQSETVKVRDYEPNNYFTAMDMHFDMGLDIMDPQTLSKVVYAAGVLNTLCTINNRKCAWRDGIAPKVGTSALAYAEHSKEASNIFNPASITDPKNIAQYLSDMRGKLANAMAVASTAPVITTADAEAKSPSEAPPAPRVVEQQPQAASKVVRPRRVVAKKEESTQQEVVS